MKAIQQDTAVMGGIILFVLGICAGAAIQSDRARASIQEAEEARRAQAVDECLAYASTHPPKVGAEIRDACISVWVGGKDRFDSDRGTTELPH